MSWLKQSDVSANHPLILRVLEVNWVDDRLLNEVYGWVNRCATQSAAFDKDYIVEVGTARMLAGLSRYAELLKTTLYCGIFEEKEIEENGKKRRVLKLVEEEDLFHMILKSDKDREKNRRADTYDMAKKGAIIKRDGAECRWCGRIVTFGNDRKSIKAHTIDHLDPTDLDTSDPTPIDRLVVACLDCNSTRKEGDFWDKELRPAPRIPYFTAAAAAWLRDKAGILVKVSTERVELHAPKPAPASTPVNGPASTEVTASDEATDTTGSSTTTGKNATAASKVERSEATDNPARKERLSTSDMATELHDIEYSEMIAALEREAVETPRQGETPAGDEATDTTGSSPAQSPINSESKNNQLIIKKPEGVGSGSVGTGRDGSGREGSGRAGWRDHSPADSPPTAKPSNNTQPRSRRRRPRRRKS
ncbi:HNH endonuclease [Glutamicibacter sp. NPDC087661]|uniref:HNH endonuclease n=1 Tax=Glutamicibacter sp. NPDC087661 TaxID=3363996 RepID=UPI0038209494